MLQFASQLVEAALTTAKQLWGTKTINTDSLLHPEPTCSLLRVPHREATPTSTITITVHKGVHVRGNAHTHSDCFTWQNFSISYVYNVLNLVLASMAGACVFCSAWWVGGPSVSQPRLSTLRRLFACSTPARRPFFQDGWAARRQTSEQTPDAHGAPALTSRLYTLTPLFHIAVLLVQPRSYSRSIWCMCQAWGGGLTDYIKLQCGKRAQRCQSGPCDGRSVEQ